MNIYESEEFIKLVKRLTIKETIWIEKIKNQLSINPFVGKPLSGTWLKEKKFEGKRLIFAVNENSGNIIILTYVNKKQQKERIKFLESNKEEILRAIS